MKGLSFEEAILKILQRRKKERTRMSCKKIKVLIITFVSSKFYLNFEERLLLSNFEDFNLFVFRLCRFLFVK